MSAISADRIPSHWLSGQAPYHARREEQISLAQFVLLSMLLHLLVISLFGAPSGGSREGRAMWGSLQVNILPGLKREEPPAPPEVVTAPAPLPPKPVVRKAPPPAPPKAVEAPAPKVETPAPPIEAVPVVPPPPIPIPQLIDRVITPETPAELKVPPALEVPIAIPAPVERVSVPERKVDMAPAPELPPPVELAPIEIPAVPIPPVTPPVVNPLMEAPVIPVPAEAKPAETIQPAATQPVAKPPVEVPAIPVPASPSVTPDIVTPSTDSRAPSITDRIPASPPPLNPESRIRDTTSPPTPSQRTPAGPKGAEPSSPFRSGPRVAPAEEYDPTKPSIDLEAAKKRATEIAREGTGQRAIFALPVPAKPKNKMEDAIEKARKPDCRKAYADMGLLAVVPLIANEFGEGNCRW